MSTPLLQVKNLCTSFKVDSGEVRAVNMTETRVREAEKLGFSHIIVPKYNIQGLDRKRFSIEIHPVRKVEEALRVLFG